MTAAGDALKTRFAGLTVRVVVPEWKGVIPDDSKGEPAVYAKAFTIKDQREVQQWIDTNNPEGWVMVLIRKAVDEQGERLFDIGDRPVLLEHVEASVVSRVAMSIMDGVSVEEAEGN